MTYSEANETIEAWLAFIHGYMNDCPEDYTIEDHENLELAFKIIRDGH